MRVFFENQLKFMAQPQYFYLQGAGLSIGNPQGNTIGPESSIINTEQMTLPSLSSVSTKRRADVENRIETSPKRQRTEDAVSLGDNLSDIEERIDGLLSPQKVDKNNNTVEEFADIGFTSQMYDGHLGKASLQGKILGKIEKHKVPQNVNLKLKKCNPIIWNNVLNSRQKMQDLKFHKIQNALIKSIACMISCVHSMMLLLRNNEGTSIAQRVVGRSRNRSKTCNRCISAHGGSEHIHVEA